MVKGCQQFKDDFDGQFEEALFTTDLASIEPLTRETRDNRPGLDALRDIQCIADPQRVHDRYLGGTKRQEGLGTCACKHTHAHAHARATTCASPQRSNLPVKQGTWLHTCAAFTPRGSAAPLVATITPAKR